MLRSTGRAISEMGARAGSSATFRFSENSARATLESMAREERATLKKEGMQFHETPNAKAYLKLAVDSAYERMIGRIKEAGRDTSHVAKLRSLLIE